MATMTVTAVVPTAPARPASPPPSRPESPALAYECALVLSDIDLSLRDDLSASVQDYLLRIVDELQQLSKWAAACQRRVSLCEREQQQLRQRVADEARVSAREDEHREHAHAALLLAQTETQLLRGEMQRLGAELAQRASAQLAYMENAVRGEINDHAAERARRGDDKLHAATSHLHACVETMRIESTTHAQATDAALAAVTRRLDAQQARLAALETQLAESLPSVAAAQRRLERELLGQQRRLEQLEAATALQLSELSGSTRESLAGLRDAQTQLGARLQVVRAELRDLRESDEPHHRAPRSHHPVATGDVVMPVGIAALLGLDDHGDSAGDCFLHAKAALPPRRCETTPALRETPPKTKRQTLQQPTALSSAVATMALPKGGNVSFGGGVKATMTPAKPGSMEAALRIRSSTLSQPVGREEDACWAGLSRPLPSSPTSSRLSPRKTTLREQGGLDAVRMATPTMAATAVALRPEAPPREPAQ